MSELTSNSPIEQALMQAYNKAKNLMGSDASNQFAIFQNEEKGYNPKSNHGNMMDSIYKGLEEKGVSINAVNEFGQQKLNAAKAIFQR